MPIRITKPYFDKAKQSDLLYVLTHIVKTLEFANKTDQFLAHNQLSNLCFNEPDSVILKKVYQEYGEYIQHQGGKKRLNIEALKQGQPGIWNPKERIADDTTFNKAEILQALRFEYQKIKEDSKTLRLDIKGLHLIEKEEGLYIYKGKLDIKSDSPIRFNEGDRFTVKQKGQEKTIYCTALFDDPLNSVLAFQTNKLLEFKQGIIEKGNVPSIGKLIGLFKDLKKDKKMPIWKLIDDQRHCENIHVVTDPFVHGLDESQKSAVQKALENDITFIWGPPGTGKSHTLARLIANLYQYGERTAVTSISNVAVDSLLTKFVDLADGDYRRIKGVDLLQKNEILRLGYAQSDEVRANKKIQFDSKSIAILSSKLERLNEKIEGEIDDDKKAKLVAKRFNLKNELDNEIEMFRNKAKVLFLTSAKYVIDSHISELEIDNLIVDEGSMMNIPTLIALSQRVKKRIIICGDFMQLGPISLDQSQWAQKWLHKDVFRLIGWDPDKQPDRRSLSLLNTQRRMASDIAELVNKEFYGGKLKTLDSSKHTAYKNLRRNGHIECLEMGSAEKYKSETAKSKSRYNKFNRERIIEILESVVDRHPDASIGIITPYAQQVADYKLELLKRGWDPVRVGTIHAFQGSECDIIILDMVDTIHDSIGRLYKNETGERLVNVAITRTVSYLMVVGNEKIFIQAQGIDMVSARLKRIIKECWRQSKAAVD